MKTFKTEIELPKLAIKYDEYSESPRIWDNLGYFYTKDSRYWTVFKLN